MISETHSIAKELCGGGSSAEISERPVHVICKGSASGSVSASAKFGSSFASASTIGATSRARGRSVSVNDCWVFSLDVAVSGPDTTSGPATEPGPGEPLRGDSEVEEVDDDPESDIPSDVAGTSRLVATQLGRGGTFHLPTKNMQQCWRESCQI